MTQGHGTLSSNVVVRPAPRGASQVYGEQSAPILSEAALHLSLGGTRPSAMAAFGVWTQNNFPATGDRSSVVLCRCAGTRAASLAGMISEEVSTYINTWLDVSRATKAAVTTQSKPINRRPRLLCFYRNSHGRSGQRGIARVYNTDVRAWMANERKQGVTSRTLARKLSAVKSFYRWLARQLEFDPTVVLAAKSPKFQAKLPRPLAEDAARKS